MTRFAQETETREFKKTLSELKEGLISLVAMLNKHGKGELWFGIAPDGQAAGMQISEKTLRNLSQAIAAHIEPAIYPKITREIIDDKACLKVYVEGWQAPYFAYGRAYIRVADEDKKLSASELKSLILQNSRDALRWESEPSGLAIEQLVTEKISRFLHEAGLPDDQPASALAKLDLLTQDIPNNAAKLFFAHQPIQLRCAVFATNTSSTIIDRHDFDGDLLQLLTEAEKYLLKNIHIGMRLEGMRRVDVPEIPVKAMREALVNAFCHRDWRDPDYVQVAIFKDRVEIRSPGTLYDNLTLDEMRRGNVSRRRNPQIAELLRRIQLVEAWGRGIPLILENAPETSFIEMGGLFITRFERPSAQQPPLKADATTLETGREQQETSRETSREPQKTGRQTNREKILLILAQAPTSTAQQLAQHLDITERGVRYHLEQLKKQGRLRRHGPTKGGHWEVIGEHE